MNGKQAKRLRKAAMGLAVTLSEAGKEIHKDGYVAKIHKKTVDLSASSLIGGPKTQEEADAASAEKPIAPPPAYQLFVRPNSVKGIYKALKKQAANA